MTRTKSMIGFASLLLAALLLGACDTGGTPGVSGIPLATVPYVGSPPASFDAASPVASSDTTAPSTSWEDFQFHISDTSQLSAALSAIARDGNDLAKLDADGMQLSFVAASDLDWLSVNTPEACYLSVHRLWGTAMVAYSDAADSLQLAYDQADQSLADTGKARIKDGSASINQALDEVGRVKCG